MKKILLTILCLSFVTPGFGCAVDPDLAVASSYEYYQQNSDVVFFGTLISFEDLLESEQIVKLSVSEVFKGELPEQVTVISKLGSSCSQIFIEKGSKYYVFANESNQEGVLILGGQNGLISERIAIDKSIKLRPAHNKKMQPTADAASD